jgi:streptomycin 6-kinase
MLGRVHSPDFVLDAAARERLIDRFGPGAGSWCDALPDLVSRYCQSWGLELAEARSGGTSRVFLGRQHGTRPVVLKLTPDLSVASTEAIALCAWAATAYTPALLDADSRTGALLLERIEPGIRLSDQPRLPSFRKIAELLSGLRVAGDGAIAGLPALGERIDFLFALIGRRLRHPRVGALITPDLVARGHLLASDLARNAAVAGLVHGDLHPGNVLTAGTAGGLVAIDPRPCAGDPAFDAVDWALGRATTMGEVGERIRRLCALMPGLDGTVLWQWCRATAVINAVQHLYRHPPGETTGLLLQLAASA